MSAPPFQASPPDPSNMTAAAMGSSSSPPHRPTPVSFLSIQQEQTDVSSSSKAPPKSLIEIQAEEERHAQEEKELARAAEERIRAEKEQADFLRWWKKEEDRIRRETRPVMGPPVRRPGRVKAGHEAKEDAGAEQKCSAGRGKRRGKSRAGRGGKADEQINSNAPSDPASGVRSSIPTTTKPPKHSHPIGNKQN